MKRLPGRMAPVYGLAVCLLAACTLVAAPAPRSGAVLPTRIPITPGPSPTPLVTPVPVDTARFTPLPLPTMPPAPTAAPIDTLPPTALPVTAVPIVTPLPTVAPATTVAPTDTPSLTWTVPPTATATLTPAATQPPAGPHPIAYGVTVSGAISDAQPESHYTFTGHLGEEITIRLERRSGDLDTVLALEDAAGHELAANDDASGPVPSDSRIERFRLPATGAYTIIATRFQRAAGTTGGDFRLTLELAGVSPAASPTLPGPQWIAYGQTISGVITDEQPVVAYHFSGEQGDVVRISLARLSPVENLDPYLQLMDAAGRQLAANDDAPSPGAPDTINAQISGFRLPATGDYLILASRFQQAQGATRGAYVLTLLLESQE